LAFGDLTLGFVDGGEVVVGLGGGGERLDSWINASWPFRDGRSMQGP